MRTPAGDHLSPQPDLNQLPGLIDQLRRAGLAVDLDTRPGTPPREPLNPGLCEKA